MAKTLNFNNVPKQYLTVTLADEKNTTLMIGTPTKAIMGELLDLQDVLDNVDTQDIDDESLDRLYCVCARIISRNKGGVKITKEYLEDIFDFEDIMIFFNAYIDFVTEITNGKN